MKSTPNATLTKPGQKRDGEIRNFHDEVWDQVYRQGKEGIEILERPFEDEEIV
jgi:hypothetical protein